MEPARESEVYDGSLQGANVTRRLLILLGVGVLTIACHAEPRWCSISAKDPSNKFWYPPIARAARVSGVVLSHIIYLPNGTVERVEPISGPRLLSDSLRAQLMEWTVKTDATGDELCQTLVIAEFTLRESSGPTPAAKTQVSPPGVLRLSVEDEVIEISDPAAYIGTINPFVQFGRFIKSRFTSRHRN